MMIQHTHRIRTRTLPLDCPLVVDSPLQSSSRHVGPITFSLMAIFRNSLTDVAHSRRGDLIDYSGGAGHLIHKFTESSSSWWPEDGTHAHQCTGATGRGDRARIFLLRNFNRKFLRKEEKKKLSHFLTVESDFQTSITRQRERARNHFLPANLFRRVSVSQSLPPRLLLLVAF